MTWDDASTATYMAESTTIGKNLVTVCLDDEGPIRPAYYWEIADRFGYRLADGWAGTVARARRDSVAYARKWLA